MEIKREIVEVGRRLYDFRLVAARGGNLSARIDSQSIMITASGVCLGELKEEDILQVNLFSSAKPKENLRALTTEFPLHSSIYKNFSAQSQRIIHCHPPLINAYYAVYDELQSITFENKLFLGEVPVVSQDTPSVTQPEKVVAALKTNNIVVIKNHGVVCMAKNFADAYYLIEELEEAVKMAGFARLLAKDKPNVFEQQLKETVRKSGKSYPMFSREHIFAIVNLVNNDEQFLTKAKELSLSAQIAIRLDETQGKGKSYKFNFRDGKIVSVEYNDEAHFVICGPAGVWELIFAGKLNPFVATTQGKLKLKGELAELSRWYVPFSRMFSLFSLVKIHRNKASRTQRK